MLLKVGLVAIASWPKEAATGVRKNLSGFSGKGSYMSEWSIQQTMICFVNMP